MLTNTLKKILYLSTLSGIAKQKKINVWLVGGLLRDIHLYKKKDYFDFDFCVEKDVVLIVKEFSKKTKSKYIVLDEAQGSYRVIVKKKNKIYSYDFTLMRGKDIKEDLSLRDFSINTLAVNLKEKPFKIIDFFGGREDLKKKILRVIKEEVLFHDPLRVLRGFSFMANLGFKIQKKTLLAMVKYKDLLKNVSGERVAEEFFKILGADHSFKVIKKMDELRVLDEFIPYAKDCRGVYQGKYHHLDVWAHSLETLRQFEVLYNKKLARKKEILDYLSQELSQGRTRAKVIKLACLLHDIGKPFAKKIKNKKTIFHAHEKIGSDLLENIALRLRLSFREKDVLKKLTFWHLRPGYLADQIRPSRRAVYRFFRDTQDEGAGVILLSLSDWRATRGPLTNAARRARHEKIMLKLIETYFKDKKKKPLKHLVDGYDIMRRFNLKPSPIIGEILHKIKEEQALGKIHTKAQCYSVAKKIIQKAKKKKRK